jgi:F-box interacting protein
MSYPLSSIFTEVTAMQLEYPLTIPHRFDLIVGSCHGILCIVMHHDDSVILWNPSIRKFTKLPFLEETRRQVCGFSFGYDHSSDTYKVVVCVSSVVVFNGPIDLKTLVKVHTLGTNSWREIQDFPSGLERENGSGKSGNFVCGTINWLTCRSGPNPISKWCIISLDLEKESYLEIMQPDYGGVTLTWLKLGVLSDCLSIFFRSDGDMFTDIWLMKEYGNKESWIKLFRVPDIRDLGSYPYVFAHYVSEDDQVLLNIKSELVIYNSRDGTFKDLNIRNTHGLRRCTQVYHESLISPCF